MVLNDCQHRWFADWRMVDGCLCGSCRDMDLRFLECSNCDIEWDDDGTLQWRDAWDSFWDCPEK